LSAAISLPQEAQTPQKERVVKNTIKILGFIAVIAVIGFTMFACASLSNDGSEKIKNVEGLKEYLESQPNNSADTPLKIAMTVSGGQMLKDVADILRSTDKYVSLKLEGPALAIIQIADSTFQDCKSLTNLDLGYGITKIGNDAFRGCSNLVSLKLPNDLSEFSSTAYTALADCPNLTTIEVSYSSKLYSSAQGVLYNKDKSLLIYCPPAKTGALIVPNSVWNIAPYAFYGSKLTSINMRGGYGFSFQSGTVEYFTIGNNAFINCSNLTSVTIKSAANFSDNAFDGNLMEVYNASGKAIMKDGKQVGVDVETLGGTFTRVIGSNTWSMLSFPSGFIGTWKRNNFGNTLTFSTNSFRDSSQREAGSKCYLVRISDNSYTCSFASDDEEFTLTFRFESGNLVIEGDSGDDQRNWNGTWIKR
jgi:hypothetical protein